MNKLIPTSKSLPLRLSKSIQILSADNDIVKKLFRPFISADFYPTTTSEGKQMKARISRYEHEWLIDHALLFGLHPENDLGIPSIVDKKAEGPIDKRMQARLAHFELKRHEKQERQRARDEKQLIRQLEEGKITEEEILEKEPFTITNVPLSLRRPEEVADYKKERLAVINTRMEQMEDMIAKWKQKKREGLEKLRTSNKI